MKKIVAICLLGCILASSHAYAQYDRRLDDIRREQEDQRREIERLRQENERLERLRRAEMERRREQEQRRDSPFAPYRPGLR